MRPPFPGMDPYLEDPALWPDVHNRLLAALADDLGPRVAPRYYIALERRVYRADVDDLVFVGRPDAAVATSGRVPGGAPAAPAVDAPMGAGVVEIDIPMLDEVAETYLEVRDARSGVVVTVLELLSPANKLYGPGRAAFEAKRLATFASLTHWVEIDLLRAGSPLPMAGPVPRSAYRILVSRAASRPKAVVYAFGVRDRIPAFPLPLGPGDDEPEVDLGRVLHAVYDRARFDLRLDYDEPPIPPLDDATSAWAADRLADWKRGR